MEALELLLTRQSATALGEPAPSDEAIKEILQAGARAPDHGRLRPWRFIVIEGTARDRLGQTLAAALQARDLGISKQLLEQERMKPLRAPMIIVVAAKVRLHHPKIPEMEQVLSAGAAAQNIALALHARGFGCMWKTGDGAYDPLVKEALGLQPHDHIVGFMYVGTTTRAPRPSAMPNLEELVVVWR